VEYSLLRTRRFILLFSWVDTRRREKKPRKKPQRRFFYCDLCALPGHRGNGDHDDWWVGWQGKKRKRCSWDKNARISGSNLKKKGKKASLYISLPSLLRQPKIFSSLLSTYFKGGQGLWEQEKGGG
jgi:hypothetical protein